MTMAVQGLVFPAARFQRQRRKTNPLQVADEIETRVYDERATDGLMETKIDGGGCRRNERGEKAE